MTVHEKVKELTGTDMHVFRPPYGDYNDNLINVVKECGYNAIQWDVDVYATDGNSIFPIKPYFCKCRFPSVIPVKILLTIYTKSICQSSPGILFYKNTHHI